MRNQRAQNIIEYILLAVAAILVFLVILNPKSGPLKTSVENTLNSTVDMVDNLNTTITFE